MTTFRDIEHLLKTIDLRIEAERGGDVTSINVMGALTELTDAVRSLAREVEHHVWSDPVSHELCRRDTFLTGVHWSVRGEP